MTFDSLFRLWRRGRLARSGRARPTTQPRIEALEVRWVPSTVTNNLTPAASLAAASTSSTAVAASTQATPQVLTATPISATSTSAATQWTTSSTDNTGLTSSTSLVPTAVSVGTPVAATPAPVNPTNTATPVPTPVVQTQTGSSTGSTTNSTTCTTTDGSSSGQTQTATPPSTTTTFNTGTSTTGSAPLLTIPEYNSGTSTNNTTPPSTIAPAPTAPSAPSSTSGTGLVIGGTVYEDKNNNGLLDSGEPGIGNNQILLKDSNGKVIATTTTNSNGQYQFTTNQTVNTSPQTQTQQVSFGVAPTNYTQTQGVQQFNPALGTLNSVQIIEQGQLTSDIKVENLDNSPSQITGTVSGVLNLSAPGVSNLTLNPTGTETNTLGAFDGTIDFAGTSGYDFGAQTAQKTQSVTLSAGSTDLSGWTGTGQVNLTQSAQATSSANGPGNVLSQISSAAGANVQVIYNYTPTNSLQPGTYTVVQPYNPPGYTPGQDTGDNKTPFPANGPPNTIPVTLTTGSSTNNNFGELKPSTLSGIAYLDSQRDGKYNSGDSIMPGVTIQLTNSQGVAVGSQVTGSDGSYTFANLAPGTYTLTVVPPQGYVSTGADPGSLGSTTTSTSSITVAVPEDSQGYNYDFGLAQPPASPPPSSPPGNPVPTPTPTPTPTPSTPTTPSTPVPTPTASTPTVNLGTSFSKRMFIGSSWGDLVNQ